jgi:hypothetical protein
VKRAALPIPIAQVHVCAHLHLHALKILRGMVGTRQHSAVTARSHDIWRQHDQRRRVTTAQVQWHHALNAVLLCIIPRVSPRLQNVTTTIEVPERGSDCSGRADMQRWLALQGRHLARGRWMGVEHTATWWQR